mmetsp:Transcript_8505/g.33621  ORF Transcript_8505/g.33621 Transcript_8505/m.33621 type:complete len:406 (-) Transcript_8505:1958-3175(-)
MASCLRTTAASTPRLSNHRHCPSDTALARLAANPPARPAGPCQGPTSRGPATPSLSSRGMPLSSKASRRRRRAAAPRGARSSGPAAPPPGPTALRSARSRNRTVRGCPRSAAASSADRPSRSSTCEHPASRSIWQSLSDTASPARDAAAACSAVRPSPGRAALTFAPPARSQAAVAGCPLEQASIRPVVPSSAAWSHISATDQPMTPERCFSDGKCPPAQSRANGEMISWLARAPHAVASRAANMLAIGRAPPVAAMSTSRRLLRKVLVMSTWTCGRSPSCGRRPATLPRARASASAVTARALSSTALVMAGGALGMSTGGRRRAAVALGSPAARCRARSGPWKGLAAIWLLDATQRSTSSSAVARWCGLVPATAQCSALLPSAVATARPPQTPASFAGWASSRA